MTESWAIRVRDSTMWLIVTRQTSGRLLERYRIMPIS